jgi:nitrogen fixation protein NifB
MDITRHPCFNEDAKGTFGRVHLPIAPGCNIQCRFCNRKYDCLNESRPGVTSKVLSPHQALHYLRAVMRRDPRISVVGIAGPGDAFATPPATLETLRLVRSEYPDMLLCVASNGLNVEPHVPALKELKTSHVTITVNAVDTAIGEKVYAWVRPGKRPIRGRQGAQVLLDSQLAAIRALKTADIVVKVNTIIIPGVNDHHVEEIARTVSDLGADLLNCMPLVPVEGTEFENVKAPACDELHAIRAAARTYLPQMTHCTRCRADAAGLLGCSSPEATAELLATSAAQPLNPSEHRPYVAVASNEGVLVNQHLGEARRFLLFEQDGEKIEFVEARPAPPTGGGQQRWQQLGETLRDCRAILAGGAGPSPTAALQEEGIKVIVAEGIIHELLERIYTGADIRSPTRGHRCGAGCAGDGTGCG